MIHWLVALIIVVVVVTTSGAHDSPTSSAITADKADGSVTTGVEGNVPPFRWPELLLSCRPVNNIQITPPSCSCPANDHLVNLTETVLDLVRDQCHQPSPAPAPIVTRPKDCAEILASGVDVSGRPLHAIYPDGAGDPFFVSCDMDTDGGGWTVFQRRENGAVDFYLDWSNYKYGFGSVSSEHWLGNDKIHRLSTQKVYELRVDLEDFTGETRYAVYDLFNIGDESTNYNLTVSGYSGNAGDSLSYHSGKRFSTKDRDNDAYGTSCSIAFQGAWWYDTCHYANLNGLYLGGETTEYAKGVVWNHWLGYYYSLKKTEMKIRPV